MTGLGFRDQKSRSQQAVEDGEAFSSGASESV